jgi:hypothetical protein
MPALRRPELVEFSDYVVAHPKLREAEAKVKATISETPEGEIIVVAGPSAVGKSTLLRKVATDVSLTLAAGASAQSRPVLEILTPSFDARGFRIVDWYLEILRALDEPGLGAKVGYPPPGFDLRPEVRRRREPEYAARAACVEALRRRGVEVLFCDEAQHMCETGGEAHIRSLLESVKYIAIATGVLIVLFGTYDLQNLLELNEQLARRTTIVEFARYRVDGQSDVDAFVRVLDAFRRRMPLEMPPVEEHWLRLHSASNGCVGLVKKRFTVALSRALASGRAISLEDLMPNAAEQKSLELQRTAIERGEAMFSTAPWTEPTRARPTVLARGAKRTPFRRKPKRDPVGASGSGG